MSMPKHLGWQWECWFALVGVADSGVLVEAWRAIHVGVARLYMDQTPARIQVSTKKNIYGNPQVLQLHPSRNFPLTTGYERLK